MLSGKKDQNRDARKIWKKIKRIELEGLVINHYCYFYLLNHRKYRVQLTETLLGYPLVEVSMKSKVFFMTDILIFPPVEGQQ